jgi:hypothetical protein
MDGTSMIEEIEQVTEDKSSPEVQQVEDGPDYYKRGLNVTVEAASNGFIIHTEEGATLAANPQQMVAEVLQELTNHAFYAERAGQTGSPQSPE